MGRLRYAVIFDLHTTRSLSTAQSSQHQIHPELTETITRAIKALILILYLQQTVRVLCHGNHQTSLRRNYVGLVCVWLLVDGDPIQSRLCTSGCQEPVSVCMASSGRW